MYRYRYINIFFLINIYFLIRTFLIIDSNDLEINYLDLNIKQYLEQNNNQGSPMVQIKGDIEELIPQVIEVIEYITNNIDNDILPELAYIFICIYANDGIDKLNDIIEYFNDNDVQFKKYNEIKTYKRTADKVTSSGKIIKIYNEIAELC